MTEQKHQAPLGPKSKPALGQNFTFEYPDLYANDSVGGPGEGCAVINICAKRVKGNPAFTVPFTPCHFSSGKPARRCNANTFGSEFQRGTDRTLHGPTESNTPHKLQGDVFADKSGIELGTTNFLDIDKDLAFELPLDVAPENLDLSTFLANDDAGARGMYPDLDLIGGPFDFDFGNAGVKKALLDVVPDLAILKYELGIVLRRKPFRIPGFDDS
jgi:hypothetical protein